MTEEMTDVEIKALLTNSLVSIKVTGEVHCHWVEPPVSHEEAVQREILRLQLNAATREAFYEINKDIRKMLEEL